MVLFVVFGDSDLCFFCVGDFVGESVEGFDEVLFIECGWIVVLLFFIVDVFVCVMLLLVVLLVGNVVGVVDSVIEYV